MVSNQTDGHHLNHGILGNDKIFPMDLEEINIGLDDPTQKIVVENKANLFDGRTKLKSANISGLHTSSATSFENMFRNCSSLTHVSDLGYLFMMNVTSTKSMFEGCTSLEKLEITLQNAPKLTNMERMFYNTPKLKYLNLDGFEIGSANPNVKQMFYCDEEKPLLVDVSNGSSANMRSVISKYNFDSDHRVPPGPWLDANGGRFSDGKAKISYWGSCALLDSSKKDMYQLDKFKKNHTPKKSGNKFTGWQAIDEPLNPQNPNGMLYYLSTVYKAMYSLVNPSTSPDNTKIPSQKDALSFVYYPTKFETRDTRLKETGSQSIDVLKKQSMNLGIRYGGDDTKWQLVGQVNWDKDKKDAMVLKTTDGKATLNNNTTSYYDPDKLTPVADTVKYKKDLTLNSNQTVVMENTDVKSEKGIYDYDLGNLRLEIPNVDQVSAGEHTGNVKWTLVVAP